MDGSTNLVGGFNPSEYPLETVGNHRKMWGNSGIYIYIYLVGGFIYIYLWIHLYLFMAGWWFQPTPLKNVME